MCGIFGVISDNIIDNNQLQKVSDVIKHRGPDDEGYLLFNTNSTDFINAKGNDTISDLEAVHISRCEKYNSAFLHRRLSIIDISSKGHQPMSYDNGNLWILLNGEIYNYIELKAELIKKGYRFQSTSDTEVVLASYNEWGEDCVQRFNGMWAFVIWDKKNNKFFFSRDRVGIKPLFYYYKNGKFIFCSEIKGIRTFLNNELILNERMLYEFLIKGQIFVGESEETIYKEVSQLMPGTNLTLKDGKTEIKKYWDLKLSVNKLSFNENVERFKDLFRQSIEFMLRSDVEVGTCLSGGLDSSSLVSFASKEFGKKFNTFSAIWPGYKCDESYYIDKLNKMYSCHSNAFTPKLDNILEVFDNVIFHQEIPLSGSSILAQWFVMEKAKTKNIKVLLDGQGADEILSGYPDYLIPYINEMIFSFKWKQLFHYYSSLKQNNFALRRMLGIQKHKIFHRIKSAFPIKKNLQSKYSFKTKFPRPHLSNFLPEYLKDQIERTNLPVLLHFEDRNSMASSVESRVPYLDHNLIEFAVNIPTEQKIHGALTKIILREAMKPYLPVEIYERTDKIGFSTPVEENLTRNGSKFYDFALDYVTNSEFNRFDLLDKQLINKENIFGIYSLARFIDIWR
jgi:asparagine synthase (glutamine-hydrolysing)